VNLVGIAMITELWASGITAWDHGITVRITGSHAPHVSQVMSHRQISALRSATHAWDWALAGTVRKAISASYVRRATIQIRVVRRASNAPQGTQVSMVCVKNAAAASRLYQTGPCAHGVMTQLAQMGSAQCAPMERLPIRRTLRVSGARQMLRGEKASARPAQMGRSLTKIGRNANIAPTCMQAQMATVRIV
jgi:hypothetical protein